MEKFKVAVVVFAEVDAAFQRDAERVLERMVEEQLPTTMFVRRKRPNPTEWRADVKLVQGLSNAAGFGGYLRVEVSDKAFQD